MNSAEKLVYRLTKIGKVSPNTERQFQVLADLSDQKATAKREIQDVINSIASESSLHHTHTVVTNRRGIVTT